MRAVVCRRTVLVFVEQLAHFLLGKRLTRFARRLARDRMERIVHELFQRQSTAAALLTTKFTC